MKKCRFGPEFHAEKWLDINGCCYKCGVKFGESWEEKRAKKIAAIPVETKQRILDLWHQSKCIGEISADTGIENVDVLGVLAENERCYRFVAKTVSV